MVNFTFENLNRYLYVIAVIGNTVIINIIYYITLYISTLLYLCIIIVTIITIMQCYVLNTYQPDLFKINIY